MSLEFLLECEPARQQAADELLLALAQQPPSFLSDRSVLELLVLMEQQLERGEEPWRDRS